ncbi:MAG TPA: response regulator, partial [Thermogutta sp.]|nr:response regulator [Thermogutta sp.]
MIKSGAASVEAKENPSAIRLDARILLAEDAPDNQRLISFILKKAGATVTVVKDGRAAVEAAMKAWENGEPFELILMDMQMPEMDGYQATRYLRDRGYSGKIVALTAHALPEDVTKALDAGCDAYLTKPIRRETFCKSLSKILAQSAPDVGPSDSNMAAGAPDVEVDPGPMPVG